MSDEPLASVDTDTADCRHPVRVRDIYLGFASAETVCVTCGQAFDPEREQELRGRDQAYPLVDVDAAPDRAGLKERACP